MVGEVEEGFGHFFLLFWVGGQHQQNNSTWLFLSLGMRRAVSLKL